MANFCVKCGGGLDAGAGFCRQCGSQVSGGQQQAPPAQYTAPVASAMPAAPAGPPAAKSGSAFKFVMIAFFVMVALGMMASVGIYFYAKSKVQEKMAEFKETTGVDVGSALESAGRSRRSSGERRDGCMLLTKQEAERILGVTIARVDGAGGNSSEEHCDYYADASAAKAGAEQAAEHFKALQSKSGGQADLKDLEGVVKGFGASVSDGSAPYFRFTVFRENAKIAVAGLNLGAALTGAKAESVAGPWDEARFGVLNSMVSVRKGDQGFMIELGQVPDGREKGLELAKVIAGRL